MSDRRDSVNWSDNYSDYYIGHYPCDASQAIIRYIKENPHNTSCLRNTLII